MTNLLGRLLGVRTGWAGLEQIGAAVSIAKGTKDRKLGSERCTGVRGGAEKLKHHGPARVLARGSGALMFG
jgi:hypothetical protein